MDSVFQYKNIVMTSRPNAVVEEMSNRFERKVENTGWNSEGVEQYVNKNFEYDKELGVQLKSFLDTHSQIKEICVVPINTALICLVWNDKDIRDKFQKNSDEDFNIQEFLAALRLKNQLLDNHTKNEKAAFIGEHRNDPKYLMTLKFLAGIVNNDDNQELIEIFWEAITCNVNGILELGIERKIIIDLFRN
ncbi:MAG: hypothetical protein ACEY3D_04255 [Rickettsia sp.]|uniref:hypothetical protein n=1 Tax=Rickettsia sp. TaxID=789 RepID=UPI00397E8494